MLTIALYCPAQRNRQRALPVFFASSAIFAGSHSEHCGELGVCGGEDPIWISGPGFAVLNIGYAPGPLRNMNK